MNGACNGTFFFAPLPGALGRGQISLKIIKLQLQSQFQRFLNQTLRVFSEIKDIKHIRRDFHLAAWGMPQGWDLGVLWGVGGQKFFFPKFNQIWCLSYLYKCHMQQHHFFWVPAPWGLGEGPKCQISLNLNYKVDFKDFYTKLCVFSHK